MDFMFEDEVDEVGSDVEAYCPKCKGDTTHVVISKYEDEIRRVQCNPCGDVHSFRKPRGDVEDDVPEPIAAKKRAMMKKLTFDEFFAKHSDKNAKPYEFREHYHENVIVTHPKFGKGFIWEILSDSKAEVTFKDSRRVLVHNRKDMPGLPLAAEGDGHPSDTKVTKNGKLSRQGDRQGQADQGRCRPEGGPQGAASRAPPAKPAAKAAKPPAAPARAPKAAVKTAPAAKARQARRPSLPVRSGRRPAPPACRCQAPRQGGQARQEVGETARTVSRCSGKARSPEPSALLEEKHVQIVEGVRVHGDGEAAVPEQQAEAEAGQHAEGEDPGVQRIPVGGMWCIAEKRPARAGARTANAIQRRSPSTRSNSTTRPDRMPRRNTVSS